MRFEKLEYLCRMFYVRIELVIFFTACPTLLIMYVVFLGILLNIVIFVYFWGLFPASHARKGGGKIYA